MQMRSLLRVMAIGTAVLAIGCDDDGPGGPATETFRATLTGAAERPTPRTTPAQGTADFTLENDRLEWTISMTNIMNVTASHIHIGDAETAGPIILFLTPGTSGTNNTLITGFVTRGTFTAAPPPNEDLTFDDVLDLMRTGDAYVNVHTNDTSNDPDNNTGPGDFPGGEIRGQIAKIS